MQINTTPSFKANYVSTVQIKKFEPVLKTFANCEANFVELVSKQDLSILNVIDRRWRARYTSGILNDAKEFLLSRTKSYCNFFENVFFFSHAKPQHRFFALTLQRDSFDTLASKQILGLAEITDNCDSCIYNLDYLQTKPTYKYKANAERKYKNIGTEIVNEIKKICFEKPLMLYADDTAIPFYKKNGFIAEESRPDILFWEKKTSNHTKKL